jgi:hypothetical protein
MYYNDTSLVPRCRSCDGLASVDDFDEVAVHKSYDDVVARFAQEPLTP